MAEDIYENADDLEMSSAVSDWNKSTYANARPEDAVDSKPSAAVRNYSRWAVGGLGMLCVLLLALGIGVTVQYMKERDQLHAAEIKLQDRISKMTKRCPSEWIYFNTKCYRYNNTAKRWNDSRLHCQSQGGDLVVIGSREEQVFTHGLARGKRVWIGLMKVNEKWKWVNNDEASTTFWVVGQPNNGGEESGVLDSSYSNPLSGWHDYYCNEEHAVICQISAYM